jgi:hypothetical protein
MKPLAANLKLLYHHHMMWITFLILISYIIIASLLVHIQSPFNKPLIFILFNSSFLGIAIGSISASIWNKPFAFVLPGHIKVVKKMLILIWLFVTLIGTASIAGMLLPEIRKEYAVLTALIGIISLIYWASVGSHTIHEGHLKIVSLVLSMLPILLILSSFIRDAASSFLITHPWIMSLTGGMISYLIYRDITRRDNIRSLCDSPYSGFLDGLDKKRLKKLTQARLQMKQDQKPSRTSELAANFFPGHIKNRARSIFLPHMWGQIYISIGRLTGYWKWLLLNSLFLPIGLSLIARIDESGIIRFDAVIFILVSALGAIMCADLRYDIHFLLRSRSNYFHQGIVAMLTALLIVVGFMLISILFSHALSAILPSLMLMGKPFEIVPINFGWIFIPVTILPLIAGFFVLLKGRSFMMGAILIFMTIILVQVFYSLTERWEHIPLMYGLIFFMIVAALTWGFHLTVLYYDSMKRSLC